MAGHLQVKRVIQGVSRRAGGWSADRRLEGGERKPEPDLTCYLVPRLACALVPKWCPLGVPPEVLDASEGFRVPHSLEMLRHPWPTGERASVKRQRAVLSVESLSWETKL